VFDDPENKGFDFTMEFENGLWFRLQQSIAPFGSNGKR
jgi:hypothetical protein